MFHATTYVRSSIRPFQLRALQGHVSTIVRLAPRHTNHHQVKRSRGPLQNPDHLDRLTKDIRQQHLHQCSHPSQLLMHSHQPFKAARVPSQEQHRRHQPNRNHTYYQRTTSALHQEGLQKATRERETQFHNQPNTQHSTKPIQ